MIESQIEEIEEIVSSPIIELLLDTAGFLSLSQYGIAQIKSSQDMLTEHLNISYINSTTADFYIEPSDNWHLDYRFHPVDFPSK